MPPRAFPIAIVLALTACKPAPPRPKARPHFTPETCPETRLRGVPPPGFGTLSAGRYEPGAGATTIEARMGPPTESVPCREHESDDACLARARDAYAARDDVKAAIAALRESTRPDVRAELDVGAPATRAAHAFAALAMTIYDEPSLTMALATTADEAAVDDWARDVQGAGGYAVSAQETTAGHFAIRIRCR